MIETALQTKIFIAYVGVLFVATVIGGLVTVLSESKYVDTTTVSVSDTLTNNELASLTARLTTIAETTAMLFSQLVGDVTYSHDYAVKVFDNELPVVSFYQNFDVMSTTKPPLNADGINTEYSFYYKHESSSTPNLDNSSLLDNSHGTIYRSNPAYAGIYMGFEDDGLWRHFPYMNVGHSLDTNSYTCVYNGLTVTGYDPRCRGWYFDAKNNELDTRFSSPYADASTGVSMISLSRAVKVGGSLLGVVGTDVTIGSLASVVLSATILNSGYTYMCDNQKQLVLHPDITDPNEIYTVSQLEFPSGDSAEINAFYSILDNSVFQGVISQTSFQKDGATWYVTYRPVSGTPYFMLMVVSESDIVEPAVTVDTYASGSVTVLITVVCIIAACVLMIGSIIAHHFSKMITAPVLVFTRVLHDIRESNMDETPQMHADIEEGGDGGSGRRSTNYARAHAHDFDEVTELRSKISNLFLAIKFSTDAYYKHDYEAALQFLTEVEEMFTIIDQKRALGVIYNNRGNILRKRKTKAAAESGSPSSYDDALAYLQQAVENIKTYVVKAQNDLADATKDEHNVDDDKVHTIGDSLVTFETILASRLSNYGDCLREAGYFVESDRALGQSLALYSKHEDMQGQLQARGNRGLLKLDMGQVDEAETEFTDALELADVRFKNDVNYGTVAGVQFASMNMGLFYYKASQRFNLGSPQRTHLIEKSLSFFYYALTVCDRVHRSVQSQCLYTLAAIYKFEYGAAGRVAIQSLCKMYPDMAKDLSSIGGVTDINFLIDISASMWGSRIKAVVRVLGDIVNNRMKFGDQVSLRSFAKDLLVVVPSTVIDEQSLVYINSQIHSLIAACTVGRTYCYKSLLEMGQELMAKNPAGGQVIVMLTDGEDNERRTKEVNVKEYFQQHDITLIVISVGVDDDHVIKTLRYLSHSKDHYVKARDDPKSIADALIKGFDLAANTGNVIMESF